MVDFSKYGQKKEIQVEVIKPISIPKPPKSLIDLKQSKPIIIGELKKDRRKEMKRILNILKVNKIVKEDIEDIKLALSSEFKRFREFMDSGISHREPISEIHRVRRERKKVRNKMEELKEKYKIPYKAVINELKNILEKREN